MHIKTFFTSLCLFFSSVVACQSKGGDFQSLSVDDFADVINDPNVQRLDVRTVAEYTDGHIPGSINLNVLDDNFAAMSDSVLQKERPVALYCRSGKRSKKAAGILSKKGYKVYDLDKGFMAWQAANKEIEK